jgi:hypothetical protein
VQQADQSVLLSSSPPTFLCSPITLDLEINPRRIAFGWIFLLPFLPFVLHPIVIELNRARASLLLTPPSTSPEWHTAHTAHTLHTFALLGTHPRASIPRTFITSIHPSIHHFIQSNIPTNPLSFLLTPQNDRSYHHHAPALRPRSPSSLISLGSITLHKTLRSSLLITHQLSGYQPTRVKPPLHFPVSCLPSCAVQTLYTSTLIKSFLSSLAFTLDFTLIIK